MTLTEATSLSHGRPVRGSIRWCRSSPCCRHRRTSEVLVARARSLSTSWTGEGPAGSKGLSRPTFHGPPVGALRARRSPPRFTTAAVAPSRRRAAANQVGPQTFADSARVKAHPGGDQRRRGLGVDRDRELRAGRAARGRRWRRSAAIGAHVIEVAVIAGRDELVQQRRVEQPLGDPPAFRRARDQFDRHRRNLDRCAGGAVQARDLASAMNRLHSRSRRSISGTPAAAARAVPRSGRGPACPSPESANPRPSVSPAQLPPELVSLLLFEPLWLPPEWV